MRGKKQRIEDDKPGQGITDFLYWLAMQSMEGPKKQISEREARGQIGEIQKRLMKGAKE